METSAAGVCSPRERRLPRTWVLVALLLASCGVDRTPRGGRVAATGTRATTDNSAGGHVSKSVAGLVGRWESTETTKGGIGEIIELAADGSYVSGHAAMLTGRYDLKDGVLLTWTSDPSSTPSGPRV